MLASRKRRQSVRYRADAARSYFSRHGDQTALWWRPEEEQQSAPIYKQGLIMAADAIASIPPRRRRLRILDVAAGKGRVSDGLKHLGDVVTIDISADMLAIAAKRLPDGNLIRADAAMLPFRDGAFDVVVCMEALVHLPLGPLFRQAHRVLSSDGLMLCNYDNRLTVPVLLSSAKIRCGAALRLPGPRERLRRREYFRPLLKYTVRRAMAESGLELTATRGYPDREMIRHRYSVPIPEPLARYQMCWGRPRR
jgi:SAM-dependent methyltransferase